jgi:hypothetical protein
LHGQIRSEFGEGIVFATTLPEARSTQVEQRPSRVSGELRLRNSAAGSIYPDECLLNEVLRLVSIRNQEVREPQETGIFNLEPNAKTLDPRLRTRKYPDSSSRLNPQIHSPYTPLSRER